MLASMKYRAVLFDFDGTLTPSLPLWVKAFDIALRAFDLQLSHDDIVQRLFYRDWAEFAKELNIPSIAEFQTEIFRGLRASFHEAELFPEVLPLIQACREHGLKTALVTSAPRFILDDCMPRLGLLDAFDYLVCADDVKNFKPHPEPVLMTLSALECSAAHALMIGDSRADILAGKAAGTATALFMPDDHEPFHRFDALRATQPDHIFVHHCELPKIIGIAEPAVLEAIKA